ncbi:MAG: glycosyltransferase [Gammaproteobacteria bacterium]|nr:glycosyltransferase [Gammaproteobacteria bacterium]
MEHLLIPYEAVRHVGEGVALVLAPHPDDEVFGCGGAIMRHVEAGDPVHVIIVSDGGFQGVMNGVDETGYVQRRQEESINAGRILGYGTPLFWGLADRDIEYSEKLVRQILSAIDSTGATVVYAPSIFEIHPDHRALGMTAIEAVRRSDKAQQIAMYEVGVPLRPNVLLDITDLIERKQAAMACFASQLDIQEYDQHITALNRYRTYTLPKSVKAAEAYLLTSTEELRGNLLRLYDSEFKRQKKLGRAVDTRDIPLVTVIIRSIGRETLSEALDSVALQTYPSIEVVVVNAKGEGHPEIGEWCGRFPSRLCGTGQALGRSRAANTGLDNAHGEYLIFLDDDDLFDPEHLAVLMDAAGRNRRVVYSGAQCINERGEIYDRVFNETYNPELMLVGNYIPNHTLLFSKELVEIGCRFDESLDFYEDWDFLVQLSRHCDFSHIDRVGARYRVTESSGIGVQPNKLINEDYHLARFFNKWKSLWTDEELCELMSRARSYTGMATQLAEKEALLKNRDAQLAEQDAQLAERDTQLRERGEERDALATELEKVRETAKATITVLAKQTDNQQRDIRYKDAQLAERGEEWDALTTELEKSRETATATITDLEKRSHDQQRDIRHLEYTLSSIEHSKIWRLTSPVRKLGTVIKFSYRALRRRKCVLELQPYHQVERLKEGGFGWASTGDDPAFLLVPRNGRYPEGWARIRFPLKANPIRLEPKLYIQTMDGFTEAACISLPDPADGVVDVIVHLSFGVQGLRLDPMERSGKFDLQKVVITDIGGIEAGLRITLSVARTAVRQGAHVRSLVRKTADHLRRKGFQGLRDKLEEKYELGWRKYSYSQKSASTGRYEYDSLKESDRQSIRAYIDHFAHKPLISVLMPVYNTPERLLRHAIESVRGQLYPNWELCIADDGSTAAHVGYILDEYEKLDSRIKVVRRAVNGHISAATNTAMQMAQGEFVALLDHDDELTEDALFENVKLLNREPGTDVIYSDQDKIESNGSSSEPFHKPDWSPELLRGVMYVGHLLVLRRKLAEKVGGFDSNFDKVQDFEFLLRVSEVTNRIKHIPKILYHWRKVPGSLAQGSKEKSEIPKLQSEAVNAHLRRCGVPGVAKPHPTIGHRLTIYPEPRETWPLVSILIPTKDAPQHLGRCLQSIFSRTTYKNFEVVVIDNDSTDPEALVILKKFPIQIVPFPGPFNFSRANNLGAEQSRGEYLILLNNDTEVVTPDWIEILMFHLELPNVAAVGPLLTYPDNTVQHAGVVLGFRGTADHVMRGLPKDSDGYAGSLSCTREVSAVTGACMMIRRDEYIKGGGMVEDYSTHYQDVDLCQRLIAGGHRILFTPRAHLIHHEGKTRGRFYDHMDRALLLDTCGDVIAQGDPYYNVNFSLSHWNYSLRSQERNEHRFRQLS